jgi:uncharacterized repeat protein (TIGR02543 family)
VLGKNTLVKTGYWFECWNTAADGSGTDYDPSNTFPISGNITLYAQWHINYKVTYNANSGRSSLLDKTFGLWHLDESLPDMPDNAAGKIYGNENFTDADGWTAYDCTLSYSNGKMIITGTAAQARIVRALSTFVGKYILVKIRKIAGAATNTMLFCSFGGYDTVEYTTDEIYHAWVIPSGATGNLAIICGYTDAAAGDVYEISFIYIGTGARDTHPQDSSGNANHLVLFGGRSVAGISGNGIALPGVARNYLRTAAVLARVPDVWAWHKVFVNGNAKSSLVQSIFNYGVTGAGKVQFFRDNNNDNLILQYYNGADVTLTFTGYFTGYSTTRFDFGWAINWTTGEVLVYRNGVLFDTQTMTTPTKPAAGLYLYIGAYQGASYFLNATIDELRVCDSGATVEEIANLYTYLRDDYYDDQTTYEDGASAPVLSNIWSYTLSGKTFSGWNTSVSGIGTHYDIGNTFPISANTTLYADWRCQITYDGNGNTGGTVYNDPTLYLAGGYIVVGGVAGEPTRVGYTFGGWNTQANGLGDTYLPGSLFLLNTNTTLYAYWTIIPTKQRLVYLDFQDGVGYRDVSSMVKYDTLSVTQRACSNNFHYVQNEANFELIYNATIYALLRTATKEILCRIVSQNGDTLTTWFTGKIAPTKSRSYNGILDIIEWKVSAEDKLQELNGDVGDICYTNYSIMNPSSPSTSIVHQLAYIRGFTLTDIGSVTISGTISKFAPNSENDSVLDILDTLLFEYGYVLNMDADGKLTPIKWINDSAASFNFTEDNIVREISVDDSVKDYYGAEIIWYELTQTSKDILLYRDDNCQYTPGVGWDGYTILPGTTYPPETNVWDATISGYSIVYQEYSDDAIRYWTNYAIVNKLDYNYKVFNSDFSGIVATSGWWSDASYDTGITATSEFSNKKAKIIFSNPTGGSLKLNYNNIYGTCWYKSAKRTLKVDNTTISGQKIDEYASSFIYDGTTASGFVQHLAAQYALGTVYYTVISESAVNKGSIVNITMNDGTNQNCIVTERIWEENEELYTYKCRAYSPDQGIVTGKTYSAPPIISPQEVLTSYLNPYYVSVGANVDGSSPDLTNAYTDMRIYRDSKEVTYDWTFNATTSGVSGSFGTGNYANRYTVSGFNSNATKHGAVTITASRAGYTSQTLVFTIDKIYQSDATSSETVYSYTPHYLGRTAYASPPTANVYDDTCTLYSTTSGLRGIYKWTAGSPDAWAKQTTPTTEMIADAWADICWAENQVTDYGVTTDYTGGGVDFIDVLGTNILLATKIFAQDVESPNYEAGVAGYRLDGANGIIYIVDGEFSGELVGATFKTTDGKIYISSTITDVDVDGLFISEGDIDDPLEYEQKLGLTLSSSYGPLLRWSQYLSEAWVNYANIQAYNTSTERIMTFIVGERGNLATLQIYEGDLYNYIAINTDFLPTTDGTRDIGWANLKWKNVYGARHLSSKTSTASATPSDWFTPEIGESGLITCYGLYSGLVYWVKTSASAITIVSIVDPGGPSVSASGGTIQVQSPFGTHNFTSIRLM